MSHAIAIQPFRKQELHDCRDPIDRHHHDPARFIRRHATPMGAADVGGHCQCALAARRREHALISQPLGHGSTRGLRLGRRSPDVLGRIAMRGEWRRQRGDGLSRRGAFARDIAAWDGPFLDGEERRARLAIEDVQHP